MGGDLEQARDGDSLGLHQHLELGGIGSKFGKEGFGAEREWFEREMFPEEADGCCESFKIIYLAHGHMPQPHGVPRPGFCNKGCNGLPLSSRPRIAGYRKTTTEITTTTTTTTTITTTTTNEHH